MNTPSFRLDGRIALVTGSSRGIGAALARGLAASGADVAIHCAGRREDAEQVAASIKQMGRKAVVIQADLSDGAAPRQLYDGVREALGQLDILVLNASVQLPEPWNNVSRDNIERQVTVNWRSSFELIQCAAPPMLERGWGRILTLGSAQEIHPHPDMVIYAATKCAQTSMVRNLAKQFAARGVTVNNLAPGVIPTERSAERLADPAYADRVRAAIPAARFGEPEDCVGAALLLCSDAGGYITGQSLLVDGGMSL
jgi:NAD(P)-dependent dehydrogenase (short-subunit alcohol dehydrogenase family)